MDCGKANCFGNPNYQMRFTIEDTNGGGFIN